MTGAGRLACPGASGARGFTLVELIVTISVAAVLLTLAAPSFVSFQRNSQLTSAANTFLAAATAARSEAMKRQLNAYVRPSDLTNWANGWSAYADVDWSINNTSGDIQIISNSTPLPSSVSISDTNAPDAYSHYVMFNGAGFLASSGSSGVPVSQAVITFTNGTDTRLVIMNGSGRMRVCNPASDTTCSSSNTF